MNKLEYIFNHFGVDNQIKKLREEVEEFIEAVISGNTAHMEEEAADVQLLLAQFKRVHKLDGDTIVIIEKVKAARTIDRIESGYYERRKQNV